jgi:hypothetical protein
LVEFDFGLFESWLVLQSAWKIVVLAFTDYLEAYLVNDKHHFDISPGKR